jgi:hypothetical protein
VVRRMAMSGDARHVVKLIMQDQPPADSEKMVANSLDNLQRLAHVVTTRVNDRIAEEQSEDLHRFMFYHSSSTLVGF